MDWFFCVFLSKAVNRLPDESYLMHDRIKALTVKDISSNAIVFHPFVIPLQCDIEADIKAQFKRNRNSAQCTYSSINEVSTNNRFVCAYHTACSDKNR